MLKSLKVTKFINFKWYFIKIVIFFSLISDQSILGRATDNEASVAVLGLMARE